MKKKQIKKRKQIMKKSVALGATITILGGPLVSVPMAVQAAESSDSSTQASTSVINGESTGNEVDLDNILGNPILDTAVSTEEVVETEESIVQSEEQESDTQAYASPTEVSSWTQLKTALESQEITEIKMKSNITVSNTIWINGNKKSIDGSGFTLNMNNFAIYGREAGKYEFYNAQLENTTNFGGPFGADSQNMDVTYRDIRHNSGRTILNMGNRSKVTFEGEIYSNINASGGHTVRVNEMILKPGANVEFINNSGNDAVNLIHDNSKLETGKNSKLVVSSKGVSLSSSAYSRIDLNGSLDLESKDSYGLRLEGRSNMSVYSHLGIQSKNRAVFGDSSRVELLEFSDMEVVSTATDSAMTVGRLWVKDNSSLKVVGNGNQSALRIDTNEGFMNEPATSLDIISRGAAPALGTTGIYPIELKSNLGFRTWSVNSTADKDKSNFYTEPETIFASFKLQGYDTNQRTTELSTNNNGFSAFDSKLVGRIATGTYAVPDYKAPAITSPDKIEIEKNSSFDPLKVSGLKAVDYTGTDITKDIKVESNNVNTGVAGNYEVTYSVKDSMGGTASKKMTVVVKEANIAQTTIGNLTTDSTTVTGTAEPNADITIKAGSTTLVTGKVGSDGKYSFNIAKQAAGTTVTATATKGDQTSSAETTVTQGTIAQTTINSLTTESTTVAGTAETNADITIKAGGTTLATGKVGSDGKYNFNIAKQAAGTKVTATATKSGQTSSAETTVTQGTIAQTTIGNLTTDSTTVAGTAETNADITIKAGGTTLATGKVGSDGKYNFNIVKQAAGTTVTATATKGGQTSNASTVVQAGVVTQGKITKMNEFDVNSATTVTGTWTGDVVKTDLIINNKSLGRNGSKDGVFSYYVGKGKIKATDKVEAVIYDVNGKELDRKLVPLNGGIVTQGKITKMNEFDVNSATTVTGTWTGDVVKTDLIINNKSLGKNGSKDGVFSYYVGKGKIKATDKVEAVIYDVDGKELDRKLVPLNGGVEAAKITSLNSFDLNKDDRVIGTWTGNVAKTDLVINDKSLGKNGSKDGVFSYYVGKGKIKATDKVEAVIYDENNNKLGSKLVEFKAEGKITKLNPFDVKSDTTVSGTWTGAVEKTSIIINGVLQTKNKSADGKFSYYVGKGKITEGSKVSAVIYDKNDNELGRESLILK